MPNSDVEQFRSVEEYRRVIDAFHAVCRLILLSFAKHDLDFKNLMIRDFVARTAMTIRGVMSLWDLSNYQDCWILYRCLLDRLFHLVDIDDKNRYESFDDWSFYEQCKYWNVVRCDPNNRDTANSQMSEPTPEERKRYNNLAKDPPKWKRPKAEEVAKRLNLSFLYKYGYDVASTHVHPMATDGLQDFFTITSLEPPREFPDQRSVLHNSILVGIVILEKSLSRGDFQWPGVIKRFFGSLMRHLNDGSDEYIDALVTVSKMASQIALCRPGKTRERE